MRFTVFLLLLVSIFFVEPLLSQDNDKLHFYVDVPLFEYPYNADARYAAVSMDQSINLTKSFYYTTHFGIEQWGKKRLGKNAKLWSQVIMTVFDFAPIPLSNTWLHEEHHRTILALYQIKSKNTYWANSVKGVDDSDLIEFKSLQPADLVREATAGNEGNLEFVLAIEKDVFNDRVNTWNYGLYWGNYLVNSFYLFGSTRHGSKPLVRFKHSEGTDVHDRDGNGYDPINATYDLFNPYVSYLERGVHPSGEGVDRYVEFDDLSPNAQQFLKNQFHLSLLNFIDLNLFGIDELGKDIKFNVSLRHHMTSFGSMVGANIFLKTDRYNGFISPKLFRNESTSFLGLDAELGNKWGILRLAGWQQPENQLYYDQVKKLGGLVQLKLNIPLQDFIPYINAIYKTEGWVAGNPYLEDNFTLRFGVKWMFENR